MNAADEQKASADDILKDLQTLREDVKRLAGQMSTLLSATSDQALDEAKKRMREMEQTVSDIGDRGRSIASDAADNVGAALEENIQKRPLTTIAFAVGLGFLVGALWRR